jgi:hypothetical protein
LARLKKSYVTSVTNACVRLQNYNSSNFRANLKLKKIKGNVNFSRLFIKAICKLKKKGYHLDILQRSAGMVINPSTVDHYAYLIGCETVAGV